MLSVIKTLVFVLVLSYGADARASQYQANDPSNYPTYPKIISHPKPPKHSKHPEYSQSADYPNYPDNRNYPDYPSCTYPKDKSTPVNCYFALQKYQVKEGIIVSPGSENQKSCYECQVKLSSKYGGGVTKIKLKDAERALKAILTCPSGYGSIEVEGGAYERTTPVTVAIEVGSGKCEDLY